MGLGAALAREQRRGQPGTRKKRRRRRSWVPVTETPEQPPASDSSCGAGPGRLLPQGAQAPPAAGAAPALPAEQVKVPGSLAPGSARVLGPDPGNFALTLDRRGPGNAGSCFCFLQAA
ncbi:unnamed protein product [Rangifer tarandus platyrhynchus]|uniref:Uncharacterized protein n=1 Tax=Rangifer tarandus platyrhynchus TaxID=3082113 RepID=A0ABN8XP18_RANTA|nr:unnamed protein product [Rangifer tarandus platyrhynchus]